MLCRTPHSRRAFLLRLRERSGDEQSDGSDGGMTSNISRKYRVAVPAAAAAAEAEVVDCCLEV